jgi:HD superfamily phosphohydrolase YqeK
MSNKEIFINICRTNIHRKGVEELLDRLEKSDFYTAPASTKFHGNYEGGLCNHSINVYEQLIKLDEIYGNSQHSKETLAVISLFHDICKMDFYKKGNRNAKDENGKWVTKETWEVDDNIPLGHGEKSCIILQQFIKLSLPELLAIRGHMSGFDSAIKGGDYSLSKAQEMTPLITLLSAADIIASNLLEKTI